MALTFRIGKMFREHGIPPIIKKSADEVIEFVRETKGGIGYVWSDEAEGKSGIKVIYTIEE